jgi:nucleoside-diphosphate-sugar epimerase
MRYLITGATGFVGGHVATACRARGHEVVALARAGADAAALEKAGVAVLRGDLTDAAAVRQAVDGADVVVHCAAKVGDWGPVEDYRPVNVDGLRHLLEACRGRPLQRFVHLSSLGVYAARHHRGTDESEPLPERHMDGYTQTKVEAEALALGEQRAHGVPVVVLRPGFVYGPRDRTVLPRLIEALRARQFRHVGGGRTVLNAIYVGNLVEAVFLAVDAPAAVGRVYNLTDGEPVTKRQFIDAIVRALGLPGPRPVSAPLWLARLIARGMEAQARWRKSRQAPALTQAGVKFLGLNLDFSIARARSELNYRPPFTFERGMAETMDWYRAVPANAER